MFAERTLVLLLWWLCVTVMLMVFLKINVGLSITVTIIVGAERTTVAGCLHVVIVVVGT
ncbi:hypothetical protein BDF20DRAFT_893749 [Mycotypha africana]|uniref:uncharacterized protein n=1 Tax=Mycotypha africana TaxID=64632 RepID=UPI002301CEE9|nr:uncharacterized protein BDF20DRAFT_893749 [Mycotypha africana]KAI8969213.1 hypothetical protein BDF20DRAFT_893749 [Mycotypha africana]